MACDVPTLLAAACTSGIGKLQSRIEFLQTWAQLLCNGADCVAPAAPVLDSVIVYESDGNYTLNWTAPADAVSYLLDLAEDVDFTIQIFIDQPYPTNTSGVIADVADATRFARVRAVSACGAISDYSNVITFSTSIPQIGFNSLTSFVSASTVLSSFTTGAYAPTANALVLAFISTENAPSSVTGNGLTWVLVNQLPPTFGTAATLQCFVYRAMGAAPTNDSLTVAVAAGARGCLIHVQEYTGVYTGGTNGSGAIAQAMITPTANSFIQTMDANGLNASVGMAFQQGSPTGAVLEGGWTQDYNTFNVVNNCMFVAHKVASTDNTFTTGMSASTSSWMAEIRNAYSSAHVLTQPSAIANLEIWARSDTGVYQDAAKTVPCTANGDLVYTWDNMGNTALTADFIQATALLRPTYNATGGANGKPRISFNSNMMRLVSGTFAQPVTLVVIGKYTGNSAGFAAWLWSDSSNVQMATLTAQADDFYLYAGVTTLNGTKKLNGLPGIGIGIVNGSSGSLYTNCISNLPGGNLGAQAFDVAATIGGYSGGAGYYLIGDEYEVMLFSRALTLQEICQIQIYAQQYYNLAF